MKEKHNYPVTTLLSKTQYLRLKEHASIRNVSASKILREYIDDNCPPMGTVAAFRLHRNIEFNNKVLEALGLEPIEAKLKNMTTEQIHNALELDVEPQDWAQKYWCRMCSDHVDTYTEGEDIKCKTCNNYVVGG